MAALRRTAVPWALALAVLCAVPAGGALAQAKASHVYMGHVADAWRDTPGGAGLLPTAEAEARVALRHAGLAAERPRDLVWMRRHVRHVVHAVDPATEPDGPGRGYGLIRAAMTVAERIGRAAQAGDASAAVKLHAGRVAASAANVARLGERIVALAGRVMAARHSAEAVSAVAAIAEACRRAIDGFDADGDGRVGGGDAEGGLAQARRHMGYMFRAEGLR